MEAELTVIYVFYSRRLHKYTYCAGPKRINVLYNILIINKLRLKMYKYFRKYLQIIL